MADAYQLAGIQPTTNVQPAPTGHQAGQDAYQLTGLSTPSASASSDSGPSFFQRLGSDFRNAWGSTLAGAVTHSAEAGPAGHPDFQRNIQAVDTSMQIAHDMGLSHAPNAQQVISYYRAHPHLDTLGALGSPTEAARLGAFAGMPIAKLNAYKQQYVQKAQAQLQHFQAQQQAEEAQQKNMTPWYDMPGLFGKATAGAAALAGNTAGFMASPEAWIGGPEADTLAGGAARAAVDTGAATGVGNLASQNVAVNTGEQQHISPDRVLEQVVNGAALGAGMHLAGPILGKLANGFKQYLAERGIDPADVSTTASETPEQHAARVHKEAVEYLKSQMKPGTDLQAHIDQQTGAGTEIPLKAARKETRQRLSSAFANVDNAAQGVVRRQDIGPGGEVSPEAQPATDATGTAPSSVDLAATREIQNAAARQGLHITPESARTAAQRVKDNVANGQPPNVDMEARAQSIEAKNGELPEQKTAFKLTEARKARRENRMAGNAGEPHTAGADYQPGGREYGHRPNEEFTYLDAVYERGRKGQPRQMVSGERVETTNQWSIKTDDNGKPILGKDGRPVLEQKVTLLDHPNQPQVWVTPDRLTTVKRPENPRMAQDFGARSTKLPQGVGTENPGPAQATDRMSSTTLRDQRPRNGADVIPGEQPPPPEPPPREGDTIDSTASRVDRKLAFPREGQATPEPQPTPQPTPTPEATAGAPERAPEPPKAEPQATTPPEPTASEKPAQTVTTRRRIPDHELSDAELAERLKHNYPGETPQTLYGKFVQARNLKPGIDAKQFRKLWESARPDPYVEESTSAFKPTHIYKPTGEKVQLGEPDAHGVTPITFENGSTGTNPPGYGAGNRDLFEPLSSTGTPSSTQTPPDGGPSEADAAELADKLKNSGGTLYSGVPIPHMVDFLKHTLAHSFGGTPEQRAEYADRMGNLLADFRSMWDNSKPSNRGTKRTFLGDFMRALWTDTDANWRILNKKFDSTTLNQLPDVFHALAGRADSVGPTYHERMKSRLDQRMLELGDIMKTIRRHKLDQKQVVNLVKNPATPRRGIAGQVAARIEKMLAEEHRYLTDAGVDMGHVKDGYFPRVYDEGKVESRRDKFIKSAQAAYRHDGADPETAAAQAEALWESIVYGDIRKPGESAGMRSSNPRFTKGRVFSKGAAEHLAGFHLTDLDHVLSNYLTRATKRAELAKSFVTTAAGEKIPFGDNFANWDRIIKAIGDEDETAKAIRPQINQLTAISAGVSFPNMHTGWARASSWVRTLTTLAHLGKSVFPSIGELTLAPMRAQTGNIPRDLLTSVTNLAGVTQDSLRAIAQLPRSRRMQAAFELAQDLGIIGGVGHQHIMAARFAGGDPAGRVQSQILSGFFRLNMLEKLTNYSRAHSMVVGQVFLRRLAHDLEASPAEARRATYLLKELGIKAENIDRFGQWMRGVKDLPNSADLMGAGPAGADYQNALRRFANQTIQEPTNSTKPVWATSGHPFGQVAFQLQSFTYSFQKNVLMRPIRMARSKGDLTGVDKALMSAAYLANIPLLIASQYAVHGLEDVAYHYPGQRPLTHEAQLERAIEQTGLDGALDPYIQLLSGVRYRRSVTESAIGPGLGTLATVLDASLQAGFNNSQGNSVARNRDRVLYQDIAVPLANLALSLTGGDGLAAHALGTAATVYALPKMADPITTALAGPPKHASEKNPPPRPGLLQSLAGEKPTHSSGGSGGKSYWDRQLSGQGGHSYWDKKLNGRGGGSYWSNKL